jgi:Tfp pilus assembly protein PilF
VKTRLIVCVACLAVLGLVIPASAAEPAAGAAAAAPRTPDLSTPTNVWEALTDENLSFSLSDEQKAAALALIESAAKAEPNDARWVSAQGILHGRMGAKEKAVEFAEKAVKLDPKSARVQFWYGTALFENIENVGMFSKMGYAGDAEKAYLTAVELDPKYMSPHVGLVQFYANAPGIAGGSLKKARKHAQAVVEIGGRSTSVGHSLLANIAVKDEDWDEASKQHRLASETATTPKDKAAALINLGLMLVRERNDPEGAMKVAEEARALVGAPDDSMTDFVVGLAKQKQGKHGEAVPMFRSVIAKNPQAMNSRFALAECLEQAGDKAGAAAMFEEFAAKFPNDKRAEDAAKRAKKLRKALTG